jgi:hypothetical protein
LRSDLAAERRSAATKPRDVLAVEAADVGQGNDAPVLGWFDSARFGCVFIEGKMRPRAVVVPEVAAQTTTETSLVEDD